MSGKMKAGRILPVIVLVFVSAFVWPQAGYAQRTGAEDLVILIDISSSMLPYFDDTVNYLIRDILSDHLRIGDDFHLITFADAPEVELSFRVENQDRIEEVLGRILLLQPLGRYTDLVRAIKYLYQYTLNLPMDHSKKLLVLTDGIHDPPPGSPYPNGQNADKNREEIVATTRMIRDQGWEVSLLQFPSGASGEAETASGSDTEAGTDSETVKDSDTEVDSETALDSEKVSESEVETGTESSEQAPANLMTDISETLKVDVIRYDEERPAGTLSNEVVGSPRVEFPPEMGRVRHRFRVTFTIENFRRDPVIVRLRSIIWQGIDILDKPVSATIRSESTGKLSARISLPDNIEIGEKDIGVELVFEDDLRIYPREGSLRFDLTKGGIGDGTRGVLLIIVFILLILILLAILVLIVRWLVSKISFAPSAPRPRTVPTRTEKVTDRSIEMVVEGQNQNIGVRNVHHLEDGTHLSVGGRSSKFLVYVLPFPSRIADLERSGETYRFVPVKPEYIVEPREIPDCLGKEIELVNKNGKRVVILFRRFVSRLERINRIMHLIDKPGQISIDE